MIFFNKNVFIKDFGIGIGEPVVLDVSAVDAIKLPKEQLPKDQLQAQQNIKVIFVIMLSRPI